MKEARYLIEQINVIISYFEDIKNNEITFFEKLKDKEEFYKNFRVTREERYLDFIETAKNLNMEKLKEKINEIEERLKEYIEILKNEFEKLNENYVEYLIRKMTSYERFMRQMNVSALRPVSMYIREWERKYKYITDINTDEDIINYFRHKNKKRNYTIFGKNGAGKTRLLKYVRESFETNTYTIPSNRNIEFKGIENLRYTIVDQVGIQEAFNNVNISASPNEFLLKKILKLDHTELKEKREEKDLTLEKMKNIFNSLGLERKMKVDLKGERIYLYNEELNIQEYDIAEGSDGEKTIIQFIMFCLLCPDKSFIFIDEPENHLNTSLLNELFDKLEEAKPEAIFIYCTHNVEFIEDRMSNLLLLENYNGKKWNIKQIDSFDEIPVSVIIKIIGTRKAVLFVEGTQDSIDKRIYKSLFPNYKILFAQSCETVSSYCNAINQNEYLNRSAKGIVDNDIRKEDEIKKLKKKGVTVLEYNEIENLLLAPEFLKHKYPTKTITKDEIEDLYERIIEKTTNDEDAIIQGFINKAYPRMLKSKKILFSKNRINNVLSEVDNINLQNKNQLKQEINQYIIKLEERINHKKADEIIKNYSDKGFLDLVEKSFSIGKEEYIDMIVEEIKENEQFRKNIIAKYFPSFK